MTEETAAPPARDLGIIMNGVSGRMGRRQHLERSIVPIRDEGGIELRDGSRLTVRPLLVGRSASTLARIAAEHDILDYTTDLDAAVGAGHGRDGEVEIVDEGTWAADPRATRRRTEAGFASPASPHLNVCAETDIGTCRGSNSGAMDRVRPT